MSSCAKCGACSSVCPVYQVTGREAHSARGKLHLLKTFGLGKSSSVFIDIFSACLLCGACSTVCPRHIDITKEMVAARESFSSLAGPHAYEKYLARKLLEFPGSLAGLRFLGKSCGKLLGNSLPPDSGLRLRLAMFDAAACSVPAVEQQAKSPISEPLSGFTRLSWFPGCSARFLFPEILQSCTSLLASSSFALHYPDGLACCGLADWAAGDLKGARRSGRKNIESLETTEGPIVVSCASCYAHLKKYPDIFQDEDEWQARAARMAARVVELSAFLEEQHPGHGEAEGGERVKLRVFYHDPCHLRHGEVAVDRARQQLQGTGKIEVVVLPDGPRCCGQGGLFHVAHPEISAVIRDRLVTDVLALDPDVITSSCSGCLMQWQQGLAAAGSKVKVLHLAQLLEQEGR